MCLASGSHAWGLTGGPVFMSLCVQSPQDTITSFPVPLRTCRPSVRISDRFLLACVQAVHVSRHWISFLSVPVFLYFVALLYWRMLFFNYNFCYYFQSCLHVSQQLPHSKAGARSLWQSSVYFQFPFISLLFYSGFRGNFWSVSFIKFVLCSRWSVWISFEWLQFSMRFIL